MVSIVSKRLLFLKEFKKGLELYGFTRIIEANPQLCKDLFTRGNNTVYANYLVSLLRPQYSGSTRRSKEETLIDNFQDFIMTLEDEQVTGYAEVLAWDQDDNHSENLKEVNELYKSANLTPPGVLGWLTGQKHKPINEEQLIITVMFDHDCMTRSGRWSLCKSHYFPSSSHDGQ
jgi:hypothetical protein